MPILSLRTKRPRRIRKRTIFAAFVGLAAIAVVAGYFILDATTARQLRRAIAEADRLDPGWRIPELEAKRAVLPDAENSARQVNLVARLLPAEWPPLPRVNEPAMPRGYSYTQDHILSQVDEIPPNVLLGEPLAAEIRQELAKHPRALIEARKLADMPRGRFDLAYPTNVMAVLLPHVHSCRNIARFLQADAALRAHDGDIDGALDSCLAILNVGRSIGEESTMISQLVRIAIQGEAMKTAQRVLAQGQASDAAMARFQAAVADEAKHSTLLAALRGERAMTSDLMGKLASGELDLGALGGAPRSSWPRLPLTSAYWQYNWALLLSNMNRAVEIAKLPDPDQIDAFAAWERDFRPPDQGIRRWLGAMTYLLGPSVASVGKAHLSSRSNLAATLALLASERHRLAHGAFPESVDRIDHRFAAGLLGDPFVGGPVRLKLGGEWTRAYIVGYDRKDDGGKFDPTGRLGYLKPGFDTGWTLWEPSARRMPPKHELPEDVFQTTGPSREQAGPPP